MKSAIIAGKVKKNKMWFFIREKFMLRFRGKIMVFFLEE